MHLILLRSRDYPAPDRATLVAMARNLLWALKTVLGSLKSRFVEVTESSAELVIKAAFHFLPLGSTTGSNDI